MQTNTKMTIHRYTIEPTIEIPQGAVLLTAQLGKTGISAWFLCDPVAPKETRRYLIAPTG